ncbi:hypothetical protein C8A00DRAFT_16659 [Chaetomidium leptoderma]|uniref:Uncharacterized protein n=1 Tax=Chaetomidium leptoderma TaxID=669021 RepID=A0AAN6ZVN2_9PEZI|nr:hypothetical protein C8A00DRAFT_16659 [Chaetomidium leptoderma]
MRRNYLGFRCPLCDKGGHRDNRALSRHLWVHHPAYAQQNNTPSGKKRCTYPGCDYEGREDSVVRHMKQHEK